MDHLIGEKPKDKFALRTFFGDFRWLKENFESKMIGYRIKGLLIIGCAYMNHLRKLEQAKRFLGLMYVG